jgi:hypothetical protein
MLSDEYKLAGGLSHMTLENVAVKFSWQYNIMAASPVFPAERNYWCTLYYAVAIGSIKRIQDFLNGNQLSLDELSHIPEACPILFTDRYDRMMNFVTGKHQNMKPNGIEKQLVYGRDFGQMFMHEMQTI